MSQYEYWWQIKFVRDWRPLSQRENDWQSESNYDKTPKKFKSMQEAKRFGELAYCETPYDYGDYVAAKPQDWAIVRFTEPKD